MAKQRIRIGHTPAHEREIKAGGHFLVDPLPSGVPPRVPAAAITLKIMGHRRIHKSSVLRGTEFQVSKRRLQFGGTSILPQKNTPFLLEVRTSEYANPEFFLGLFDGRQFVFSHSRKGPDNFSRLLETRQETIDSLEAILRKKGNHLSGPILTVNRYGPRAT